MNETHLVLRQSYVQRILAGLMALMGLANIASALLVHDVFRNHLLHALLPMEITSASRSLTLIAGFGLLIMARGLWHGKRAAWALTMGLLGLSACVHLVKGLDWEESLSALVLGAMLFTQRRQFIRRSDPPTLRRVPVFVIGGTLAICAYGMAGFWLLQPFHPFSLSAALQELYAAMTWSDGPYDALVHGRAAWFLDSLGLLSLLLGLDTLGMLLRPVLPLATSEAERQQAEALVRRYATSSLAPFACSSDKHLYFGQTVAGVVSYRLAGRVAVVCGDPIAAPAHVGALAREFVAFCAHQDWQVCFYEVQPGHLADYAPLGFESIKIGEDAWIDLAQFTLKGSKISDIRHAVSKVQRDGTQFHLFDVTRDAQLWQQMQDIEEQWRAKQGGIRLHFSIGQLPRTPSPEAHYTVALGKDGATVLAFCSFLPIERIHGLALDIMRRAPHCPNGTMEFLIARSLEHFRDAGFAWVSLGLAPLANVDATQSSRIERSLRAIYTHPRVNAAYHYQSLFFFKNKFCPQWRGGYLLFSHAITLPQVLAAVLHVHVAPLNYQLALNALRAACVSRLEVPLLALRRLASR